VPNSIRLLAWSFPVALSCALCAGSVSAQTFPWKPIRIIVPNAPGVPQDVTSRILGSEMSKLLGQPVIIENKPGSNGTGYEYVAKQVPPDGHTIASVSVSGLASLPATVKSLRFDPVRDLPPFIGLAEARYVFGSSVKQPWNTFDELVAYAKKNPGKLNYGTSNIQGRLLTEAVMNIGLGLNITHIPYSTAAAQDVALVAGDVHMGFVSEATAVTVLAGKFRALGISGQKRAPGFPDVPIFSELGFPQVRGLSYSFNLPRDVPKPVIEKLYAAASKALTQPEVVALFSKIRWNISEQSTELAAKSLGEEVKTVAEIARKVGIQPE